MPPRVLIAGGGVAALETLLALRSLAEERVAIELLAPERDFVYRPLAIAETFELGEVHRFDVTRIAADQGARHRLESLSSIHPARHSVTTSGGTEIERENIGEYWSDFTKEIQAFANGDTVVGTTWPYQYLTLKADGENVKSTVPEEGSTGWSDTWMVSSEAEHPNCMYLWMNHIIDPKVNAQVAEWFGEAPANSKACEFTEDPAPVGVEQAPRRPAGGAAPTPPTWTVRHPAHDRKRCGQLLAHCERLGDGGRPFFSSSALRMSTSIACSPTLRWASASARSSGSAGRAFSPSRPPARNSSRQVVEVRGEGSGRLRLQVLSDASQKTLTAWVRALVAPGAIVHTDGWKGYDKLAGAGYEHRPRLGRRDHPDPPTPAAPRPPGDPRTSRRGSKAPGDHWARTSRSLSQPDSQVRSSRGKMGGGQRGRPGADGEGGQ